MTWQTVKYKIGLPYYVLLLWWHYSQSLNLTVSLKYAALERSYSIFQNWNFKSSKHIRETLGKFRKKRSFCFSNLFKIYPIISHQQHGATIFIENKSASLKSTFELFKYAERKRFGIRALLHVVRQKSERCDKKSTVPETEADPGGGDQRDWSPP